LFEADARFWVRVKGVREFLVFAGVLGLLTRSAQTAGFLVSGTADSLPGMTEKNSMNFLRESRADR
jgi:hypothetical protein